MTKIEQKQDELIKSLKELVNLCDAPQYFEIIAAKKAMKEIVEYHESDLAQLKAEAESFSKPMTENELEENNIEWKQLQEIKRLAEQQLSIDDMLKEYADLACNLALNDCYNKMYCVEISDAIRIAKEYAVGVAKKLYLRGVIKAEADWCDHAKETLKAMEGEEVSDEVRDYFDLIYDNIPVSVDNCILPDHAREELANILNAAMRDNLIKKADDHT